MLVHCTAVSACVNKIYQQFKKKKKKKEKEKIKKQKKNIKKIR